MTAFLFTNLRLVSQPYHGYLQKPEWTPFLSVALSGIEPESGV